MTKREAPVHIMRWAPGDWLASALRGELALERDHLTRAVYRDLLDTLHARGGYLPRSEVGGACLVTRDEAEHAVQRLLASGRIEQDEEGRIFNRRILDALEEERAFRDTKRESGSAGGRATAAKSSAESRAERAKRAATKRWEKAGQKRGHGKQMQRACVADAEHVPSTSEAVAERMRSLPPPPPLPPPEKNEEPIGSSAPPGATIDAARLVNLLGKEPGTREEKVAWLEREIPNIALLVEREVANGKLLDTPAARMAEIRSRVIRHYRQQRGGEPGSALAVVPAGRSPHDVRREVRESEARAQIKRVAALFDGGTG